jgi:hypothetical protein
MHLCRQRSGLDEAMLGHCGVMHIKLPLQHLQHLTISHLFSARADQIEGVGFFLGFFASLFFFC